MTGAPTLSEWVSWAIPATLALAVPAGLALAGARLSASGPPRRLRFLVRVAVLATGVMLLAEFSGISAAIRASMPQPSLPSSAAEERGETDSASAVGVSPGGAVGQDSRPVAAGRFSALSVGEGPGPRQGVGLAGSVERRDPEEGDLWSTATWLPGWVWFGGFALLIARSMLARVRFARRVAHSGIRLDPGSPIHDRMAAVARRLSLRDRRWPRVVRSDAVSGPVVFGFFRPTMVVPADFDVRFTEEQQEAILAHELAHVALGDLRFRCLADLVVWSAWWHPGPWWLRRVFRDVSEACADEAAAALDRGPRHLAESLVALGRDLVVSRGRMAVGPPSWTHAASGPYRSRLGRRVDRLLSDRISVWRLPARWTPVLTGFLLLVIATPALWTPVAAAPTVAALLAFDGENGGPNLDVSNWNRNPGERPMTLLSRLRGSLLGVSLMASAVPGVEASTQDPVSPPVRPEPAGAPAELSGSTPSSAWLLLQGAGPRPEPPVVRGTDSGENLWTRRAAGLEGAPKGVVASLSAPKMSVHLEVRCSTLEDPFSGRLRLAGDVKMNTGGEFNSVVVRNPVEETLAWARRAGTSEGSRYVPVQSGQTARVAFEKKTAYVERFEIMVGPESVIADPVVGSLDSGHRLEITPKVTKNGIDLGMRLEHDDLVSLEDRVFEMPGSASVTIQVPRVEHRSGELRTTVESGATLLWLLAPKVPGGTGGGSNATWVEIRATAREIGTPAKSGRSVRVPEDSAGRGR